MKSATGSTVFPSISHEVMGPDAMILVFWILSFKPTFPLSYFTFIKRLFNSSLSAIRVESYAYLRLLIFLLAILIPACASSSPVFLIIANRWGKSGNSDSFISGGSKITADGGFGHEIQRHWLLRRKVMTKLDNILKSRDITLPTVVHLVKAMFFPVIMYGCESWTIEKAECRRIDTFELWCWRRLLGVPWTARRSVSPKGNQTLNIHWKD